ncbi:MAG: hypothetical protein F4X03_01535 [Dehalococcoidia bacterium]|nr:hypothetical protein [Dehalococcoidia bacterium]
MPDFPYVLTSSKASRLFAEIRDRGKPTKVNRPWLEAAGFKSKNDRAFVNLLKFLGVIDNTGTPTDSYDLLRNAEWQGHLADIIRSSYQELFSDYENAHTRTKQQLMDQMRSIDSTSSSNVLDLKATTFLNVCGIAQFSEVGQETLTAVSIPRNPAQEPRTEPVISHENGVQNLTVNLNIALEIPTVTDQAVYDAIFSAMARNIGTLLSRDDSE